MRLKPKNEQKKKPAAKTVEPKSVCKKAPEGEAKENALLAACNELNKQYSGEIPFISPGGYEQVMDSVVAQSTGILSYDRSSGGGFWDGKINEVFGPEGGGKTTMCLKYVATQMGLGKSAIWADAEHSLNMLRAKQLGIKVIRPKPGENLGEAVLRALREHAMLVMLPVVGEHCFDAIKAFCGLIDIMVVDSVPALIPTEIVKGSNTDTFVGAQARMMAQGLMNIVSANKKKNPSTIVFINQLSSVINAGPHGKKTTTPGGRRLKFYARNRTYVTRIGSPLDQLDPPKGHRILTKTEKNSFFPDRRESEFNLLYTTGDFDLQEQVSRVLLAMGRIDQKGSWLVDTTTDDKWQGFDKMFLAWDENEDYFEELLTAAADYVHAEISAIKNKGLESLYE